ncbi:MAG TPA: hypothetical protein VGC06_27070, partial [Actinomycetes bacterium]
MDDRVDVAHRRWRQSLAVAPASVIPQVGVQAPQVGGAEVLEPDLADAREDVGADVVGPHVMGVGLELAAHAGQEVLQEEGADGSLARLDVAATVECPED